MSALTPHPDTNYSLWRATKKFRRAPIPPLPPHSVNSRWIRDDVEKVEYYADHLQRVFSPHDMSTLPLPEHNRRPSKPLFFSPKSVAYVLDRTNIRKAPGADRITGRMLRELPRAGILWLTRIYNASLRLGTFPTLWKNARVIMLPKVGKDPTALTSYRPISLLSTLSKVFEKLLHRRLLDFLPTGALPDHQFGFRAHHSTTDQLRRITSSILQSLERKEYCAAAFLEVAQAFDRVWHNGIAVKLSRLFPDNICILLRDYLSNRSFHVVYGDHYSTTRPITAGVPQGSVLGPLLYALYTADMPETPDTVTATFADDTALLASSPDYTTATNHLQAALDSFYSWTQRWKILISSENSSNITFTLRPRTHIPVHLDRSVIPYNSTDKYLGIHLDERLTYAAHVHTKRRELDLRFRQLYWLLGSRSPLSLANKRLLYLSTLRPVWAYALPVWGCACDSLRATIQRFQNKSLRAIAGAPWFVRNETLHHDLRLPTVNEVIATLSLRHERCLLRHPNTLALTLLDNSETVRRLHRRH